MGNSFDKKFKLRLVKSISWDEVFLMWKKQEEELPYWIAHYKERGFNSWQDWRTASFKDLHLELLEWNLYEIPQPLDTVPMFRSGPFMAWIKKYYNGNKTVTFETLAKDSDIQDRAHINEIVQKFPENSVFVGLENMNDIVIIEGLHRCCALAVAKMKKVDLKRKVFIACAQFPKEIPILDPEDTST
jgi:hypothetical protein